MQQPFSRSEFLLDLVNVFLSDVRYGLGAYLGVYLLSRHHWDEASIGLALSLGGIAGLLSATLTGMLVDKIRDKRKAIVFASLVVMSASLTIPAAPWFGPVVAAGVVGAVAGTLFAPAISAISLGMVGYARFPLRAGRNEAMFHAGNAVCNLVVLGAALWAGDAAVFWVMAVTSTASIGVVLMIPKESIDPELARGLTPGGETIKATPIRMILANPTLKTFAICGAVFHLANGSMLGLLGQKLALSSPGMGIALTAICAIAAQIVMVPTAIFAGVYADRWGRKRLYSVAFVALTLRGMLFSLSNEPMWLIAVQLLDGVGAGITAALFAVVIADATRGLGHFALAQAGVGSIHGIGGTLSAVLGGELVGAAGYNATFLALAFIAAVGFFLFLWKMPETAVTTCPQRTAADRRP